MDGPRIIGSAALLLAALLAAGCASAPGRPEPQAAPRPRLPAPAPAAIPAPEPTPGSPISASALGLYRTPRAQAAPPSQDELKVLASAKELIGQLPDAKVLVNDRTFVLDCVGTVCAIYYRLDLDLAKDFGDYGGNGVSRLYQSMKAQGILHADQLPRPGDVIVWDNTWDANGNGDRTDDPRTHAGIVLAVDEDGTIHYVHEHLRKGVIIEVMNLKRPGDRVDESGKLINSALAQAAAPGEAKASRYLAGELLNAFGDVLAAKAHYLLPAVVSSLP